MCDGATNESLVFETAQIKLRVETLQCPPDEALLHMVLLLFGEDKCAECGRQRQCYKAREQDARSHRNGELPIEHAFGAAHERHGDEY